MKGLRPEGFSDGLSHKLATNQRSDPTGGDVWSKHKTAHKAQHG